MARHYRIMHKITLEVIHLQNYDLFVFAIGMVERYISNMKNANDEPNYDTSNRFGTNTLWGTLFKKKNAGYPKFQYGRHLPRWPPRGILKCFFCLKMAVNGQKRSLWQQSVWFEHAKCTVLFKYSGYLNMATNFQDCRHRLSRNTSFALGSSRCWKRWFEEKVIYLIQTSFIP